MQLLLMLIESMLGPCPGNQDLIAKSDVIIAINNIIPAFNPREDAIMQSDPTFIGIKGLSCLL